MSRPAKRKWTILSATLGQRGDRFARLMNGLLSQLKPHNGAVTVCALWNNGERPLSHIRQALVEHANSEYISFVDDDDVLPGYFVEEVLRCLEQDPDYVGWRMQCIMNGEVLKPTFHSLEFNGWSEDDHGFYRDISHLNPIRRTAALYADYQRGDPPEDVIWADQIRASGALRTQCYIGRIMYMYHASSDDSTWRPGSVPHGAYARSAIDDPNFEWHPDSAS